MHCPRCHADNQEKAQQCVQCGAALLSTSTSIVPIQRSNLPALLYRSPVPRGVAASVGAVALGVGIELLRRNVLPRMLTPRKKKSALPAPLEMKELIFPQQNRATKLPRGYEIHESVIYMTRIIRRED